MDLNCVRTMRSLKEDKLKNRRAFKKVLKQMGSEGAADCAPGIDNRPYNYGDILHETTLISR